jgi:hypothetical protein
MNLVDLLTRHPTNDSDASCLPPYAINWARGLLKMTFPEARAICGRFKGCSGVIGRRFKLDRTTIWMFEISSRPPKSDTIQ